MADGGVPMAVAEALVALTERALRTGLEPALRDLLPRLADAIGAEAITVELPGDGGGPPDVQVVGDGTPLAPAVAHLLSSAVAVAQQALAVKATDSAGVDELRALARLDDLTGALNRRAFLEAVDTALDNARQNDCHVTVAVCDLDGLKAINDAHGHPTGDAALCAFVDVLASNLRGYDSIGRMGGDEFGLILPGTEEEATAKILDRLTRSIAKDPTGVAEVQASFGTARFPDDADTRDALLAIADSRLYEHKSRTR